MNEKKLWQKIKKNIPEAFFPHRIKLQWFLIYLVLLWTEFWVGLNR
ncbi:MAG: hypothetical protein CM15mV124_010 [uncultured marine virus]|nr:MAG: hypothetical protein CM15mV124_010 [uncultured marine virus]